MIKILGKEEPVLLTSIENGNNNGCNVSFHSTVLPPLVVMLGVVQKLHSPRLAFLSLTVRRGTVNSELLRRNVILVSFVRELVLLMELSDKNYRENRRECSISRLFEVP